jgi:small ligand-binding sensory domain FIST
VIYSIPTRGFTAAVSVFMGTPPAKPLICKSVSNHPGALISDLRADPTGEEFCILCAIFSFVRSDIIETSFYFYSQSVHLSLLPAIFGFWAIKNPAYTR